MVPLIAKFYPKTLRTFFTMAVDDVLPFSDLLSDDLLRVQFQYRFTHRSRSSSSPKMDSACNTLPSVKERDGSSYEPDSLTSLQRRLEA